MGKCSPSQFRYLDFVRQFSTVINHIACPKSNITNVLSDIKEINGINYKELIKALEYNNDLQQVLAANSFGLKMADGRC